MAVIKFTKSDLMQLKTVEPGFYTSEVTKIEGPTKSGSGKSINYFFDVAITEGDFKGKTKTITFSTGVNNQTMLGEMQFFPTSHLTLLDAAISNNGKLKADGYDLDLEQLLHKPFDAKWSVNTVEGRLVNLIDSFHPKGYGAEAGPF